MKKIYFSIILMLAAFVSVSAKVIYLTVNVTSPAAGATLTVGVPFNETAIITNNGPGAIVAGDTVWYIDPTNQPGQAYLRVNQNKAVGDTIYINKTGLTLSAGATNGPANFCVYGFVTNGTSITPDSLFKKCNAITIAGGTSQGVGELHAVETVASSTLSLFPNPSSSIVNLGYAAQNNSAVVATVYDVTGREVMVKNFGSSYVGKTGFQLNLESLTNGLYIVELRQDGVKSVGRVNKN